MPKALLLAGWAIWQGKAAAALGFLGQQGGQKVPLDPSLCQSPPKGTNCVSLLWGGLTASRPSIFSPIGFHLPEGRLLRASRPVNQGHRAPPRPPRGFITGIPMARALATNLLPPGPAQPSDCRAQSTRSRPSSLLRGS